ncbi:polyribonucleotide nucleotidyltransferase [Erysipelothrix inopinata]|uniref:Polyribonucleotide nucleotidyltransferase n=1 Tax=Erysipelothrix inopinata TaxID=225084 RepID=A0A7G9RYF2_9FIRM|nr:polyribonucleotide nucleotidyltransferase [Erysipelothrix inopinata]QNN60627.1 polyribonucleotide nucleotidyltransferase [Erysipelothrix inopinata]
MSKRVFNLDFCGRSLSVETGEIAKQAGGSVLVRYEDTAVLSAATASKKAKDIDFFPLTVTYEEKLYAVGKIPGGFLRREGRPSEHATLTSRLIDRTIRPLFAEGFRNEVQVVNTVLSVDQDCAPDMAAMFGASLALCISDVPFEGPIAGVVVGLIDGEYIINPTIEEQERSRMHLIVAGTKDAINMVEAGAEEVSEEEFLEAMMFGHRYIQELCDFQIEIAKEVAKEKMEVSLYEIPEEIKNEIEELVGVELRKAVAIEKKLERYESIDVLEEKAADHFEAKEYETEADKNKAVKFVKEYTHSIVADEVRRLISIEKIRPDGRKVDEVRPLDVQIDLLKRVHGSGLFTRGETQVLSVCTLGATGDTQIIDDLTEVESKRFLHHYNFPPYSVGETGRMGAPGRREIGHGALGERALSYVLPSFEEFPYTIRLVAEVLESNGSSSQASICAGSIAMMAAGVPVKAAVSGIAMGLVQYGDDYTILTDIQGMEDHFGDMDFKVAGTKQGITALQMDIKIKGLSEQILREALAQAKVGRAEMMTAMDAVISEPRDTVGEYAPKIAQLQIAPDKIRDVIGQGGKVINQIIEDCDNVKIDIEDDGRVVIYHTDLVAINKAKTIIEGIVKEAKVGEIYKAKVVRIEKFGAFVNLWGTTDGLLHVSKIAHERVEKVEDVLKLGDVIEVKVTEIDDRGRINVSRKALLPKPEVKKEEVKTEEAKPATPEEK